MFTEEQIRQIIRDELSALLKSDRYVFHKTIELLDGRNIQLGQATGTKFGTSITDKIGFYGTTPIVQRTNANQAAIATDNVTQTTPWGFQTAAQGNNLINLANELRAALVALGLIKGSA